MSAACSSQDHSQATPAFLCPLHRYCKIQQLQDHVCKAALNTPALASPVLLTSETRGGKTSTLALPRYSYFLAQRSTMMHSPPVAPPILPTPCPKAQGLAGGLAWMVAACKWLIPTGVTHGVVLCSAALVKPLAKATLDLASVLHATKGEERKRLGPWRTALAPNLSQLLLTYPAVPCLTELRSQQDQSPGPPQGGNNFSCFTHKETEARRGCEPAWEPCREPTTATGAVPSNTHPLKHAALCLFSKSGTTLNTHNTPLVGCHLPLSPIYSSIKNMQQWHGSNLDLLLRSSGCSQRVSSICCKPLFAIDYHVVVKICSGLQVTRQAAQRREH